MVEETMDMDAKKIVFGVFSLILLSGLSGCSEQGGVETEKIPDNILFESDVVKLDSANLEFVRDDEDFGVRSVELQYRLHNPLNRYVTVVVDVVFYDEFDRDVYSKENYEIKLPADYTEGVNSVVFDGSQAGKVDYVKIIANEKIE